VRALGGNTAERSPAAPNMPTLAEQGIPGYATDPGTRCSRQKGPQPIIDPADSYCIMKWPRQKHPERMTDFGSVAVANTARELSRMLREKPRQWAKS